VIPAPYPTSRTNRRTAPRVNDRLDFLDAGGNEPHGFDEFYASVDVVVIGRRTFDVVQTFGEWPYGAKQVVVLSSRPLDAPRFENAVIEQMSGAPAEISSRLSARGFTHAYVDGGVTIRRFLAAGLIDRLVITRVNGTPVESVAESPAFRRPDLAGSSMSQRRSGAHCKRRAESQTEAVACQPEPLVGDRWKPACASTYTWLRRGSGGRLRRAAFAGAIVLAETLNASW